MLNCLKVHSYHKVFVLEEIWEMKWGSTYWGFAQKWRIISKKMKCYEQWGKTTRMVMKEMRKQSNYLVN